MKLHYDDETEAFRAELRAWLEANLPDADAMQAEPSRSSAHMPDWARAWQRRLFDAGIPSFDDALVFCRTCQHNDGNVRIAAVLGLSNKTDEIQTV